MTLMFYYTHVTICDKICIVNVAKKVQRRTIFFLTTKFLRVKRVVALFSFFCVTTEIKSNFFIQKKCCIISHTHTHTHKEPHKWTLNSLVSFWRSPVLYMWYKNKIAIVSAFLFVFYTAAVLLGQICFKFRFIANAEFVFF